jgi:uncharacterized repeat protein (TIGR01451 family)
MQTVAATVLWSGPDPFPGNESASAKTLVTPAGPADIALTLAGVSAQAMAGTPLRYEIQIANLGPATAAGIVLQYPTPAGLSVQSVTGDCGSLPCTFARMESGQTRNVSVTFWVPSDYAGSDPVVNTASVSETNVDPDASNDSATVLTPFFVPGPPLSFHTLAPCRLLDTRPFPLPAGGIYSVPQLFVCGIPPTARALALNVTVTEPSASGHLKLYPTGLPVPGASTLNYAAGQTRGSNAIVGLSAETFPAFSVKVAQPSGTVHVVVDVFGYFE